MPIDVMVDPELILGKSRVLAASKGYPLMTILISYVLN